MTALKVKNRDFIFTPHRRTLGGIFFTKLRQPYLFTQGLRNFNFGSHYLYNAKSCKMEIDEDTNNDVKMDPAHKRYLRLHEIVSDKTTVRTAAWYSEHNDLLLSYDKQFRSGFSDVHPEITDPTFRSNCERLDFLISKLLREFDAYSWFPLVDYLQFNQILISVVDTVSELYDDDLSSLFSSLSVY